MTDIIFLDVEPDGKNTYANADWLKHDVLWSERNTYSQGISLMHDILDELGNAGFTVDSSERWFITNHESAMHFLDSKLKLMDCKFDIDTVSRLVRESDRDVMFTMGHCLMTLEDVLLHSGERSDATRLYMVDSCKVEF